MVRDDARRALLFDLDTSIQELTATVPQSAAIDRLLNIYHNLLRHWADT
jgi:PKHD-type hydroxylase